MTNVQLIKDFIKTNDMKLTELFAAVKVIERLRRVRHYTLPFGKAVELYQKLVQHHGERCAICKKKVPFGVSRLFVASRWKSKPLKKNPKLSEVQLLCKRDAKIFFSSTYKGK